MRSKEDQLTLNDHLFETLNKAGENEQEETQNNVHIINYCLRSRPGRPNVVHPLIATLETTEWWLGEIMTEIT